ncbi:hypothetical protein CPB85DRAFT_1337189, partial [Mucidula mucida]
AGPASPPPLPRNRASRTRRRMCQLRDQQHQGLKARLLPRSPHGRTLFLKAKRKATPPDTCDEIRRKIRKLQKEPGFKITHWLREIGGINNNSYHRFMKLSGAHSGVENGTYKAAYMYFEKVGIAEGKKKTSKRKDNEWEYPEGIPLKSTHREKYFYPASWFPDSP